MKNLLTGSIILCLLAVTYYLTVFLPQKEKKVDKQKELTETRLQNSQRIQMYNQFADECQSYKSTRLPQIEQALKAANDSLAYGENVEKATEIKTKAIEEFRLLNDADYIQACANLKLQQSGY